MKALTVPLLLLLLSGPAAANGEVACLVKHYDEYSENRVALFEKMHRVYARKYPETYTVYASTLTGHRLFAQIDQFVFRYFAEHDLRKLKLRHGFTNATPNWIRDACKGRDCTNALYRKLSAFPEFNALYAAWEQARKETEASYRQKEIAEAGKRYFELLGEPSTLPHALKDMGYYRIRTDRLTCN